MTANKRIFVRDFLAFFNDPPAFDKDKPNLLDASAGSGNPRYQHTIATGLDYVITSTCSRPPASRISTPTTYREQRRRRADVGDAGREVMDVHPGQDSRAGHAAGGSLELGLHRHVLRRHAAVLAGLRLDARVAQHLVRRLLDAAELDWRRHRSRPTGNSRSMASSRAAPPTPTAG